MLNPGKINRTSIVFAQITSEQGRYQLIEEILQCILVLTLYGDSPSNKKYKKRLELLYLGKIHAVKQNSLKEFYKSSRFYCKSFEQNNGPKLPQQFTAKQKVRAYRDDSPILSDYSDTETHQPNESTMKHLVDFRDNTPTNHYKSMQKKP